MQHCRKGLPTVSREDRLLLTERVISRTRSVEAIDEIVSVVRQLDADQFLRLRKRLDRLEEKVWKAELDITTKEMRRAGLADRDIDQHALRRRREGRS